MENSVALEIFKSVIQNIKPDQFHQQPGGPKINNSDHVGTIVGFVSLCNTIGLGQKIAQENAMIACASCFRDNNGWIPIFFEDFWKKMTSWGMICREIIEFSDAFKRIGLDLMSHLRNCTFDRENKKDVFSLEDLKALSIKEDVVSIANGDGTFQKMSVNSLLKDSQTTCFFGEGDGTPLPDFEDLYRRIYGHSQFVMLRRDLVGMDTATTRSLEIISKINSICKSMCLIISKDIGEYVKNTNKKGIEKWQQENPIINEEDQKNPKPQNFKVLWQEAYAALFRPDASIEEEDTEEDKNPFFVGAPESDQVTSSKRLGEEELAKMEKSEMMTFLFNQMKDIEKIAHQIFRCILEIWILDSMQVELFDTDSGTDLRETRSAALSKSICTLGALVYIRSLKDHGSLSRADMSMFADGNGKSGTFASCLNTAILEHYENLKSENRLRVDNEPLEVDDNLPISQFHVKKMIETILDSENLNHPLDKHRGETVGDPKQFTIKINDSSSSSKNSSEYGIPSFEVLMAITPTIIEKTIKESIPLSENKLKTFLQNKGVIDDAVAQSRWILDTSTLSKKKNDNFKALVASKKQIQELSSSSSALSFFKKRELFSTPLASWESSQESKSLKNPGSWTINRKNLADLEEELATSIMDSKITVQTGLETHDVINAVMLMDCMILGIPHCSTRYMNEKVVFSGNALSSSEHYEGHQSMRLNIMGLIDMKFPPRKQLGYGVPITENSLVSLSAPMTLAKIAKTGVTVLTPPNPKIINRLIIIDKAPEKILRSPQIYRSVRYSNGGLKVNVLDETYEFFIDLSTLMAALIYTQKCKFPWENAKASSDAENLTYEMKKGIIRAEWNDISEKLKKIVNSDQEFPSRESSILAAAATLYFTPRPITITTSGGVEMFRDKSFYDEHYQKHLVSILETMNSIGHQDGWVIMRDIDNKTNSAYTKQARGGNPQIQDLYETP